MLSLDCSKSNRILKWKPILNSKKSVEFTCDWYKDFFLNKDMKNITLKQVNYFFDRYF